MSATALDRIRIIALGLVSTAALCLIGLPASAAPAPTEVTDPATTQIDHIDVEYGAVKPTGSAAPSASLASGALKAATIRCWTLDVTRKGKNIFGGTLITFKTHTYWCGDGSWIRLHASTTSSHDTAFGWSYEGLVRNYDQYGINWNQFHSVRQAQFCLLNCVAQSKYLTNDISVGPNGQVWHT